MYFFIIIWNWVFNNVNIYLFFYRLFINGTVNNNSYYCTFYFKNYDKIIIIALSVLIVLTEIILLIKIKLHEANDEAAERILSDLFCKNIFRFFFSLVFCANLFIEEYEIGKNIYWFVMIKNCIGSLQGTILFFVFFKEEKVIKILFKFENINLPNNNNNNANNNNNINNNNNNNNRDSYFVDYDDDLEDL